MSTKYTHQLKTRMLAGLATLGLAFVTAVTPAYAGPFIFAGTDGDDHGFFSGTNQQGWLFMQKALTSIAPSVTNGNQKVYILGSTSTASAAANSAFSGAGLAGWTVENVTVANFANFFGNVGAQQVQNGGILMMDSGNNVGGGVDGSAFAPYAATINTFIGDGGGLFSQANGYGWLAALGLGVTVTNEFDQNISLTAAGSAAFPGLTNADLSSGPYHNNFSNIGAIPILGTSNNSGNAIIIGSNTGRPTNPGTPGVPDGGSFALVYLGLAGLMVGFRRGFIKQAA